MHRETKDRAQSCETPGGDPWIDFPGRKKSGRLEEEKRGENYLPADSRGHSSNVLRRVSRARSLQERK